MKLCRLANFKLHVIFNYAILLPERFSSCMTRNLWKEQDEEKKSSSPTPGRVQHTIEA